MPRQSGKTTLARMAFPGFRYVSLEDLQNRQEAQTLVAVARELGEPDGAEFLSLDPFFRQGAGDVARSAGFP